MVITDYMYTEVTVNEKVIKMKKCSDCCEPKPLEDFYELKFRSGHSAYCKECSLLRAKIYNSTLEGKVVSAVRAHNKRAEKLGLIYDLTKEDLFTLFTDWENRCCLSGNPEDVSVDHFISLSTGHVGTTRGNMILLNFPANTSKYKSNPFEWFPRFKDKYNLDEGRFEKLVIYLANLNNMTPKKYKEYVYWCYDNPKL